MSKKINGIQISNPNKIIYKKEKISKYDIANYYSKVADRMMPFLNKRLLSVVRCHSCAGEDCFFKKHPTTETEHIQTVIIHKQQAPYFYVKNAAGIVNQAQMGTLEFHIWASKVDKINKPDIMTFDLDPDKKMPLQDIREGVKLLKKLLDNLNLVCFLKTSGGKGYHVLVPFPCVSNWQQFSLFAKHIAEILEAEYPAIFTTNIRKAKRKGKIFLDWLRNKEGATCVSAYSLRNKGKPTVSMPIFWEELDIIAPDDITIDTALQRLSLRDPFENFFRTKQKLK